MSAFIKLLSKILNGTHDRNIEFAELCRLLQMFDFKKRVKGNHHIFTKDGVTEIINIQPDGNLAKPYQVKQVRNIILNYKLGEDHDGKL